MTLNSHDAQIPPDVDYAACHLGDLTVKPNLELDRVRNQINQMVQVILAEESEDSPAGFDEETKRQSSIEKLNLSNDWCFIDCMHSHKLLFYYVYPMTSCVSYIYSMSFDPDDSCSSFIHDAIL